MEGKDESPPAEEKDESPADVFPQLRVLCFSCFRERMRGLRWAGLVAWPAKRGGSCRWMRTDDLISVTAAIHRTL
jgi:hypothetical protein